MRPSVGQCFRCQKFGHAQWRCTAPKRCLACTGKHEAEICPRPKTEPATCANSSEKHLGNYPGCPRFPKPQAVTEISENPQSFPRCSFRWTKELLRLRVTTISLPRALEIPKSPNLWTSFKVSSNRSLLLFSWFFQENKEINDHDFDQIDFEHLFA